MSIQNNIILSAAMFGSVYLCANSLNEINNNARNDSLPFYCNYFIFALSAGIFTRMVFNMHI